MATLRAFLSPAATCLADAFNSVVEPPAENIGGTNA